MGNNTYTQVIQDILDNEAKAKTFKDKQDELIWRMGYVMGTLGKLAEYDFTVAHLLDSHLEKLTGIKKKK